MPKFPRISGRKAITTLEKLGFLKIRQRGSHIVMRRNKFGCVIPDHKELASGTLKSILRQANINLEEFKENL